MCLELLDLAKEDRISRTRFGARGLYAILEPIVAQCALVRMVVAMIVACDDAKGTGHDAVATAVADILLHVHGVELGANDGSRRTGFVTGGVCTVLAYVTVHQPAIAVEERERRARWRLCWRILRCDRLCVEKWQHGLIGLAACRLSASDLLDELHMSPRCRAQLLRIVVARPAPEGLRGGELIPLLASDLAGFTPDTETGVGEEAQRWLRRRWWLFAQRRHRPLHKCYAVL